MDVQQREVILEDPANGVTEVSKSTQQVASSGEVAEARTNKKNQVIWYIVGIINALLVLRLIFLVLGARSVGFANVLYSITDPFVSLFKGVFPAPQVDGAYFDTAALLAIVIISLLGWGISSFINVANRPAPVK
jgi:uncharacterized protein YggT (Ycf19 family)